MNQKTFICNGAAMAIPSQVNSIENNRMVMVNGYAKNVLNILKGEFTETTKQVSAGNQVTQRLVIEAQADKTELKKYSSICMLEISLSSIGNVVWGSAAIPVNIVQVENNLPTYKITFERTTNRQEF